MSGFPRPDYAPLQRYVPDRRPVELDLSDNTNLRGPHPAASRVLAEVAAAGAFSRYPTPYADEFRAAVAARFDVPEACVVTGCGSDALIDEGLRAAAPTGGIVAFPSPTFVMVEAFSRMNGLVPRPIPWDEAAADPLCLLRDDPSAVYICSPNNPTGAEFDFDGVRSVLARGGGDGPPVFLDEAYADFAGRSMAQEAAASRRLVILRTMSKAWGLAGLRAGFAIGAPEVIAEMEKSRGPYKVSRLSDPAAAAALSDPGDWLDSVVAELVENRELLREELVTRGYDPLPSAANFLLLRLGSAGTAIELASQLRDQGVGVRAFPSLEGVGDSIRVSVGPWPMMERFLDALDRCPRPVGPPRGAAARGTADP